MKKLLLILLCVPLIGYNQETKRTSFDFNIKDDSQINQIININLGSLLFNEINLSYEKALRNQQSLKISIPIYDWNQNEEISPSLFNELLVNRYDDFINDWEIETDISSANIENILEGIEGSVSFSGRGLIPEYRKYFDKNTSLSGFYIAPHFIFREFSSEANINLDVINDEISDEDLDKVVRFYEASANLNINALAVSIGHQWIRKGFTIDFNLGAGQYTLKYTIKDKVSYFDGETLVNINESGTSTIWLPKMGLSIGIVL